MQNRESKLESVNTSISSKFRYSDNLKKIDDRLKKQQNKLGSKINSFYQSSLYEKSRKKSLKSRSNSMSDMFMTRKKRSSSLGSS